MPAKPTTPKVADPDQTPPVTTRETVEARKRAIREKEAQYQEDRRKRFTDRGEDEDPPNDPPSDPDTEDQDPPADPPADPPTDPGTEDQDPPADPPDEEPGDDEDDDFDDFEDDEPADDEDGDEPDDGDLELDDDDGDDGDEPQNIKTIRARLKEEGGKRKAAEARLIELEEEVDRIKEEKRSLEERNKDIAASQINWNAHDVVTPMWGEFDEIVNSGARTFNDAEQAGQFRKDAQSALLQEYYDLHRSAKTPDEKLSADIQFKATLADRYGMSDATPLVDSVRNAMKKYMDIQDAVDDLKKKHEEGRLSVGVRAYEEGVAPFEEQFEDLGNVERDFIDANPQSVEAVVGKRFAEDEEFRAKAVKHKERIKQFVFGLRPLTQTELDKAEARASTKGVSLEDYLKTREQNYEAARRKFFNDVFYSGMAMEEFGDMRKVYDRWQANKRKRESAKKAIKKGKEPEKSSAKPKDKTPVRAKDKEWVPPSRRDFSK